jgi:acetoacetate decarboxylase
MPHDPPELPELINTVLEFVDGIAPKLDAQDRYHALCAGYLLEIVLRELADWQAPETADDRRLRACANLPDLPVNELTRRLSAAIRAGKFDQRMDELLETLTEHVVAKVKVSRPSCLEPEHR